MKKSIICANDITGNKVLAIEILKAIKFGLAIGEADNSTLPYCAAIDEGIKALEREVGK